MNTTDSDLNERAAQLSADAATVAHLSTTLMELQRAALELATQKPLAERGYFTPTQEERLRQMQATYWQTRAALMELVESLRRSTFSEHDRPRAFLIAYAVALLLVDAARFLREQFHEIAAVRRKLDEPELSMGIPPGMYSAVQKSLTSSRHAWHLYHAIGYFAENEQQLRRLGAEPDLAPVLDVVDRLGHRVDVSVVSFARTKLRVRGRRLGHHIGRGMFGRSLYGLQKLCSSMVSDVYVRRGHRPRLPEHITAELLRELRSGDVLIVRKEHAVTNYFLPGFWPHAALYLGTADDLESLGIRGHPSVAPLWAQLTDPAQGTPYRVLEALKDGVRLRSVASPLGSDSVVVIRPRLSRPQIGEALARGLKHEGKCYDFDFNFDRSDRLVCTEVVYRAYEGIGGIEMPLTRRAGRNTLSAGDLLQLAIRGNHFEPRAVYSPTHAPELLGGSAAMSLLKQQADGR